MNVSLKREILTLVAFNSTSTTNLKTLCHNFAPPSYPPSVTMAFLGGILRIYIDQDIVISMTIGGKKTI